MDIKGVCYDVGRAYSGYFLTRRVFDPTTTRRELQIIRDDLLSSVRPDERGWLEGRMARARSR